MLTVLLFKSCRWRHNQLLEASAAEIQAFSEALSQAKLKLKAALDAHTADGTGPAISGLLDAARQLDIVSRGTCRGCVGPRCTCDLGLPCELVAWSLWMQDGHRS